MNKETYVSGLLDMITKEINCLHKHCYECPFHNDVVSGCILINSKKAIKKYLKGGGKFRD